MYIYTVIYIYMIVTVSLGGLVAERMWYNLVSAQYL